MEIFEPHQIEAEIVRAREARDFRPTVAALAMHTCETTLEPEFLLARSAKEENPDIFWFIQGGVEVLDSGESEHLGVATARELDEEPGIGVCPDFAVPLGAIRYENGRGQRKPKGGFLNGNFLIAVGVDFCETAWRRKVLNDEIAEVKLLNEIDTRSQLISNVGHSPHTAEKALFFIRMIDRALDARRV